MSDKKKQAIETFQNGYNCAQSVFSVFSEELGISKDAGMKLANPFGAGITYLQETCGAVTGSLMAIGLKYGKGERGTAEDKERAYDMSRHFLTEFKKAHGSLQCRVLMEGHDMSSPEGIAKIQEMDLFRLRCMKLVQNAVEITESILSPKSTFE
jgi:C_GCAxxG_C_C family probable redox protein